MQTGVYSSCLMLVYSECLGLNVNKIDCQFKPKNKTLPNQVSQTGKRPAHVKVGVSLVQILYVMIRRLCP